MSIESNNQAIQRAFRKALANIDKVEQDGMIRLLEWGVEECFKAHKDYGYQRHLEMGDSYGWMLLHNGVEVRRKLFAEGAEAEGNANTSLDYVKAKLPQNGWVGVVLAGMNPPTYFSVAYEFKVMRTAIRDLKSQQFSNFFKPIK